MSVAGVLRGVWEAWLDLAFGFDRHRHIWRCIRVRPVHSTGWFYAGCGVRTIAMWKCSCGAIKTSDLEGEWTVADLNGNNHRDPVS